MSYRNTHIPPKKATTGDSLVCLDDVHFSYHDEHLLTGLNLRLGKGEILGLVGPNGAGKSTILNLIQGILPSQGGITVFGGRPGNHIAKRLTGTMPQNNLLIRHVTVREIVRLMADQYANSLSADDAIEEVGLSMQANQSLDSLSGGQLRKVTYACAIVHRPELLFLDEPTVGMDAMARRNFWTSVRTMHSNGTTIVITSHYLEEIQQAADRIAILQQGHFSYIGTWKDLQATNKSGLITFTTSMSTQSLHGLPCVTNITHNGQTLVLTSSDTDRTVKALAPFITQLHDLSVERQSFENVYLDLINTNERH